MNLYNIIFSSALYSLILLLIEGIVFFTVLYTIFNDISQTIINNLLSQINNLFNLNYNLYYPLINNLTEINFEKESSSFKTLAIKLYSVGTMYEPIISEQKLINLNKIKSYIFYTLIIVGFIVLIITIVYINNKFYNKLENNNINKSMISYTIIISLLLFILFIVLISFIVFINITKNININDIQIKVIDTIFNLLNK